MRNSLRKLEGVQLVEVDYELGEAYVQFDAAHVQVGSMIEATAKIGFPSSLKIPEAEETDKQ